MTALVANGISQDHKFVEKVTSDLVGVLNAKAWAGCHKPTYLSLRIFSSRLNQVYAGRRRYWALLHKWAEGRASPFPGRAELHLSAERIAHLIVAVAVFYSRLDPAFDACTRNQRQWHLIQHHCFANAFQTIHHETFFPLILHCRKLFGIGHPLFVNINAAADQAASLASSSSPCASIIS